MKLTVERKPASIVVLDITADDDEFAEAMTKAYRKVSKDIQIPGFRKGKAPRSMVERMYGRDVFLRDAADEVMDKLYRQALEQEDITPVGEPEVEINALEPVNFVVSVPVYPTIDVKDYAGVRVEPQDAAMDDSEIDEVLGRLQRSQSEWVEVADDVKPGEHDQVTVDYEVMLGDEPFQEPVTDAVFVLGETNLLAQLREKLEGLTKGESATFDIAFDEDDDTADPSIRGKSLAYTVTVKDIKRRELLPLDDDFAKKVNETETLEELRGQIAQDIHAGKTQEARTSVLNDIIEAMANQAEIDPPSVMVDEEVNHQLNHLKEDLQRSNTPWEGYLRLQDKTEDDIKEELRPVAESRLRNSLFLQEVGRKEEIAVTDEDIDGEINKMVGLSSNLGPEASEQATRMAELYRSDYFKNMIRSQLFEQKLTDRIIEIATEGKGAVLNGFVPPEPVEADVIEASSEVLADDTSTEEPAEAFTNTDGVPFDHVDGESTEVEVDAVAASDDDATTGAEASDDVPAGAVAGDGSATAPEGYPIKGNASSRIYHVPGGGSYDATIAEFHFATEEEAEAAGFRAAKR